MRPPSKAPRRLPMPPSTAAVNALMPMMKPMLYFVTSKKKMKRRPAAPAMIPPSRNVSITTRSMLTPMSVAVSESCETARTPRPRRVRFTNWSSATIMTSAATITNTWSVRMSAPKKVNSTSRLASRGNASRSRPLRNATNSEIANDAPMAEISAARRVAPRLRSGRYATRSSTTADAPEKTMAAARQTSITATRVMPVWTESPPGSMPIHFVAKRAPNVPSMKISEFAKLIRRRTP